MNLQLQDQEGFEAFRRFRGTSRLQPDSSYREQIEDNGEHRGKTHAAGQGDQHRVCQGKSF